MVVAREHFSNVRLLEWTVATLGHMACVPDAIPRFRKLGACELVCTAMHAWVNDATMVVSCLHTLDQLLVHGLNDVPGQSAALARLAVVSTQPAEVKEEAKRLMLLLTPRAAPSDVAASTELVDFGQPVPSYNCKTRLCTNCACPTISHNLAQFVHNRL